MKDYRNIIFASAFLGLGGIYFFYTTYIDFFISSLITSVVLSAIFVGLLARKNKILADSLSFYIFPILSTISLFAGSTLINRQWIYWLGLIFCLLNAFYFKQVYIYHFKTKEYKIGTLQNFSNYANLIVFMIFSAAMYGFRSELGSTTWLSMIGILSYALLLIYHLFWANKIEFKDMRLTLPIAVIAITQVAWGISMLPFDYLSSAILLSITFYTLSNIAKFQLQAELDGLKIKFYLSFSTISYILIFLSVRWL